MLGLARTPLRYRLPEAPAGTGLQILFAALDTAFGELALHKLSGEVLADNPRSLHLHQKVGFSEEGRFREQHHDGAERIDIIRLGLLASEWAARRPLLSGEGSAILSVSNGKTMNPANRYLVEIFWSDEDEGFIAIAPDLPGCSAFGDT